MIHVKYGMKKPNAFISRAVDNVTDNILIYTLRGSIKAVNKQMTEILPTIEHSFIC